MKLHAAKAFLCLLLCLFRRISQSTQPQCSSRYFPRGVRPCRRQQPLSVFVFGGYAAIVLIRTSPPRFSSVSINHLTFLVECFVGYSDKHICSLNRFRVCYNKPIAAGIKSILVRVCLSARPDRYACFELSACTVNIGTQFAPNRCGNMPLFKPLRKFVCICTADPVKAAFLDGIQRNKIHMAIYAAKL